MQNPQASFCWILYGQYYQQLGQYDKCIECLENGLALEPTSEDAKWNLCISYLHVGNIEKAKLYYDRLVEQGIDVSELKEMITNFSVDTKDVFGF